ncbi:RNA polymerase factor sigma-54 [Thalassobacillus sp. B23F22_16]|uniref:RNA polymerase factor sigma-54 n=1 Tax=Thalassobacillus sp. B23F22_16 TaxID=3459513 RepID=UPI00373E9828
MMELSLSQRQTTNLAMTTELRQAISLLQFSSMELTAFIQEQALENPLIELKEKSPDVDHEPGNYPKSYQPNVSPLDFATKEKDIREDLWDQARLLELSEIDRLLMQYLIWNIDDNGYLPIPEKEIAEEFGLPESQVVTVLESLQQLEPAGVGTKNLSDYLVFQLRQRLEQDSLAEQMVVQHLNLLAEKKWRQLAEELDANLTEIREAAEIIQQLKPKPLAGIAKTPAEYVRPDISVKKHQGRYKIILHDSYLPSIQVNTNYRSLITQNDQTAKYVKDHYQKAIWLMNSIEQRQATMMKIAEVLVDKQAEFFEKGFTAIQPLTLKEVAEAIGVHESTVSRAKANKVIQTPQGCFELSIFFTSKLSSESGSDTSSTKVKALLKQLIEKEDKNKPISDQKISDYFKTKEGITVSRRTVAKYREELRIPASSKRKQLS